MTTIDETELHECACGCGELVTGKWKRGHWARSQKANAKLQPLPGPDDELPDLEDDDEEDGLPAELIAEIEQLDRDDAQRRQAPQWDEPGDDPPPARLRGPRATPPPSRGRRTVTATVQRDVKAKIRMILMPAAKTWEMRDHICGPVAVQQEPEISEALAEIVCDSPDLLNWFTGPAGGYMKYFKLFMAVQPVLMVVWVHHIAHGDGGMVDAQAPRQPSGVAA